MKKFPRAVIINPAMDIENALRQWGVSSRKPIFQYQLIIIFQIVLHPSISPGIVSFLYSLLTTFLWISTLYISYQVLAVRVAVSPIDSADLRQVVLLNQFGTYLNPHPTYPWWKPGFPYAFESKILYRGTAWLILFLLFLPRLAIGWAELLVREIFQCHGLVC